MRTFLVDVGGHSGDHRVVMLPVRLVHRDLLDPREADEAVARPIADAVNIPFSELPERTHELPGKDRLIRVAAPEALAREAVEWLEANGRRATAVDDFHYQTGPGSPGIARLWEPNALLSEVLPQLACGASMDLACGTGRDAVFISSCGWNVTAVDRLPDALDRARALERRCAPAIRPIRWVEADLETGAVDLGRRFDLLTVFRFLHRPLLRRLRDWLIPGGSALCETFTTLHRDRHGKPARNAFVLRPGELPTLLEGLQVHHYSEDWRGQAHTARIWAVRQDQTQYGSGS